MEPFWDSLYDVSDRYMSHYKSYFESKPAFASLGLAMIRLGEKQRELKERKYKEEYPEEYEHVEIDVPIEITPFEEFAIECKVTSTPMVNTEGICYLNSSIQIIAQQISQTLAQHVRLCPEDKNECGACILAQVV